MMQPKHIQISYDLFKAIKEYIEANANPNDVRYEEVVRGIRQKEEALIQRTVYTIYKVAPSESTRADARNLYLDRVGVPSSFRWPESQDSSVTRHNCDEQ